MEIIRISPQDIKITPTEKKIKKVVGFAKTVSESILPKEVPLERDIFIWSEADNFDRIKNSIQLNVEKITASKTGKE